MRNLKQIELRCIRGCMCVAGIDDSYLRHGRRRRPSRIELEINDE